MTEFPSDNNLTSKTGPDPNPNPNPNLSPNPTPTQSLNPDPNPNPNPISAPMPNPAPVSNLGPTPIPPQNPNPNPSVLNNQPLSPQPTQPPTASQTHQTNTINTAKISPKKSKKNLIVILVVVALLLLIGAVILFFVFKPSGDGRGNILNSSKAYVNQVPFEGDFGSSFVGKLLPAQSFQYYYRAGYLEANYYKISINQKSDARMRVIGAYKPDASIFFNLNSEYRYTIKKLAIESLNQKDFDKLAKDLKSSETPQVKYRHFSYKGFDVYSCTSSYAYKHLNGNYVLSINLDETRTPSKSNDNIKIDAIKAVIDDVAIEPVKNSEWEPGLIIDKNTIEIDDKLSINLSKINIETWTRRYKNGNLFHFTPKSPNNKIVDRVKIYEIEGELSEDSGYEDIVIDGVTYKVKKDKSRDGFILVNRNEFYYEANGATYTFEYSLSLSYIQSATAPKDPKEAMILEMKEVINAIK